MSARIFYRSLKAAAMAALGLACFESCRLAVADWLFRANTPASVARAVAIDPGNAAYHAWLAEIEEHDGLDPSSELETAAALNPSESAVLIRLGLHTESKGDDARAENYLLAAARVDKLFAPRWTLANYYLRAGDTERFWGWARQALDMSYGDLSPLFELCWRATRNPEIILARGLPARHELMGKYLKFLLDKNELDAAAPAARRFVEEGNAGDTALALNYCDRLIERGAAEEAVSVWNALCDRKLLSFSPLAADRGFILTNGDFQSAPLQQGFDWRTASDSEIPVTRAVSPPELRFHLSGKQPEHCELLSQFVPATAGKQYVFEFEYKTSISGLRWKVGSETSLSLAGGGEWSHGRIRFASPGGSLERIALLYERLPGFTRAEGEIWLRNTTIALAPRQF